MKDQFELREVQPGFKVCTYQTDRFKTGKLSLYLILPLGEDRSAQAVLPYLLSRSCAAYPDTLSLSKRLAELYGATLSPFVFKIGENQVIGLSMTMIDRRFALDGEDLPCECMELLCQALFEPHFEDGVFSATDLEREKRLMLERIEGEINDKRVYALNRCIEIMCGEEAYRFRSLGSAEGVKALTPQSMTETWKRVLKTARMQLNVVGSGDVSSVAAVLTERLNSMERGPLTEPGSEVIERAETVRRVNEEQPVKQGKLVLGYRAGLKNAYEDYPALRMMTDIFGGGTYSRCFDNVREKQSLCYYCAARLRAQKGIIFVQSGIENENAEKAIEEINKQLQGMANGDVTEEDLANSRRALADSYGTVCDTPGDIDGWAAAQICDPVFETPEGLSARYETVTTADIVEAAKRVTLDTVYMLYGTMEDGEEAAG